MGVESFANQLLDDLCISDPADLRKLEEIAWARKAIVRDAPLQGAEARLSALGNRAVITISTTVTNARRRRFGIAHELGHWEMRFRNDGFSICASADLDHRASEKHSKEQEIAANEFAGALLLPSRFIGETCRTGEPTFRSVRQLADRFEVSLTATALRLVALSAEACALVYSENGCIKWFQGSRGFQDLDVFVLVGEEVATNCMAARHFDGKICPPQPKRVKASAWFAPGDYNDDASILEDAVALPAQNAVLSLLWIDDDLCET
jgi:Zn-dependent peptidase ImmA (M78 family)